MNKDKEEEWKEIQRKRFKNRCCMNCGESIKKGGHFVPPSLGKAGFYHCQENRERVTN